MTEQAEPAHPVWGEPFEGQLLEASGPDPARVVALQQAVSLAPAIVAQGNTTSPDEIVTWAEQFEAYLTSDKE